MEHYVCKGSCHGLSENPGMCSAEGCSLKGWQFEKCNCTDDRHGKSADDEKKKEDDAETSGESESM
jgi:hypothetical protein